MRSAQTIYKEIMKAANLSEEVARRPRTLFDTKKLTSQAQLIGILKALAWVTGELKQSPVDDLLQGEGENETRRSKT